jgi:hypothetical protein
LSGSDLFLSDNQPQLTHTICEDCYKQVVGEDSPEQAKNSHTR